MTWFNKPKPLASPVKPEPCFICHDRLGEIPLHAVGSASHAGSPSRAKEPRWICSRCADERRDGASQN